MPEETSHKWTKEETLQLIKLRNTHANLFTKRRNAAKEAWKFVIREMGLQDVSHKQASKKWDNLQKKYKEVKKPGTGGGTDQGGDAPKSWPYFRAMQKALGSKPSTTPPVLIASALANPTILTNAKLDDESPCSSGHTSRSNSPSPRTPPSPGAPSTSRPSPDTLTPPAKKKKRATGGILEFLRNEAAKEDQRHTELYQQTERLLSAFEKMVEKM